MRPGARTTPRTRTVSVSAAAATTCLQRRLRRGRAWSSPPTQLGRSAGAHLADRVVELADGGEPRRERDVAERQVGGLDQHTRGLRPLGAGQRERVRADLRLQHPLELAGGVADRSKSGDAVAVHGAVGDQPHGPRDHVTADIPFRRPGRGVGAAALAGPEARPLRGRRGGVEPHVASERRSRRATGPAVDLRGQNRGDEPPVEPGVLGLDRPIAAVEIVVHTYDNYTRHRHHWRKSDIV